MDENQADIDLFRKILEWKDIVLLSSLLFHSILSDYRAVKIVNLVSPNIFQTFLIKTKEGGLRYKLRYRP